MKQLTSKRTGKTFFVPALSELQALIQADDCAGYCMRCGEQVCDIEPDMRNGVCDECGARGCWGAEEMLISGLYHDDEAAPAPGPAGASDGE